MRSFGARRWHWRGVVVEEVEEAEVAEGLVAGVLAGVVASVAAVEAVAAEWVPAAVAAAVVAGAVVAAVVAVGVEAVALARDSSSSSVPRRPSSFTCGKFHTQHRCFSRLDDAWREEMGEEYERSRWHKLLKAGVDIFALDFDAIISAISSTVHHRSSVPGGPVWLIVRSPPPLVLDELEAPLQTLHLDVWGPARVRGQGGERYFLLVVDDYSHYTTVFPLRTKGEVPAVLIPWIRAVCLQLHRRFRTDLPLLRLHSDRGDEFSSDLLRAFCQGEGIEQSFTLPGSPQQNGVAERRIGLVMEITRTSLIHEAAPDFLWSFVVWYAAQQLNLWPRVSLPETSPTLRWTGEVGDASRFRVCSCPCLRYVRGQALLSHHSLCLPWLCP
ncbi:unnamed protein product [Closterium sp. Yama58-4]|nr:unnamed protein product [Closterium sp. Yama58-4]